MVALEQARYGSDDESTQEKKVDAVKKAHHEKQLNQKIENSGLHFKNMIKEPSFQNTIHATFQKGVLKQSIQQEKDGPSYRLFQEEVKQQSGQNLPNAIQNSQDVSLQASKAMKDAQVQTVKVQASQRQQDPLPLQAQIFVMPQVQNHQTSISTASSRVIVDPRFAAQYDKGMKNQSVPVQTSFSDKQGSNSHMHDAFASGSKSSQKPEEITLVKAKEGGNVRYLQPLQNEKILALQHAFDTFKKQLNIKHPHLKVQAMHPDFGRFEIKLNFDKASGMLKDVKFFCEKEDMRTLLSNNRQGFEKILANYRFSMAPDAIAFHSQAQQIL